MGLFKKKRQNLLIEIRRNDYLAAITASIGDAKYHISECKENAKSAVNLINYCKDNKLRGCRKVAETELKLIKKEQKFWEKHQKELLKHYERAFRCIKGSG